MKWTDEAEELLKKLHAQGLSAGQISDRFGCTRNSICGKLARLGYQEGKKTRPRPRQLTAVLPRTSDPGPRKGRHPDHVFGRPNTIKPWNPPTLTSEQIEQVLGSERRKGIPLTDTVMEIVGQGKQASLRWSGGLQAGQCKWVVNAQERGGEYLFCGVKVLSGCVYCEEHERRAYGRWTAEAA